MIGQTSEGTAFFMKYHQLTEGHCHWDVTDR
jgi:hypothetical protein